MIRSKLSQVVALVAFNLAGLVVIVVGCELIFGNWLSPFVPPAAALVSADYTFHQTLYEPTGEIRYIRDKYGLRGRHEPLGQIQVVTVGGSTTDQRYLGEGQTWQDVWRKVGNVAVVNAGVDGMSSFGHIIAVTEWLHKIPGLKPKYYLHYIGDNDASLSGDGRRVYDRSGEEISRRRKILRRSILVKAVAKLLSRGPVLREVNHQRLETPPIAPLDEMSEVKLNTQDIEQYIAKFYKSNLRHLLALHKQRGEGVIFVSQPANPALVRWKDGKAFVAKSWKRLGHFALALGIINRANGEVCAESANCRFVDLAGKLAFARDDFYDLVHSTPSGAHKIGKFLAQELPIGKDGTIAVPGH